MTNTGKKILITGATGFIGSEIYSQLKAQGNKMHLLSFQENLPSQYHPSTHLDITQISNSLDNFKKLLEEESFDTLIHIAWYANPKDYIKSDLNHKWLEGSTILANEFLNSGGKRIIAFGSCLENVSGAAQETPYVKCKKAFKDHILSKDGDHLWLKIFYAYGKGSPIEKLIPSLISSIRKPFNKGEEMNLREPNALRDFINIEDIAKFTLAALESNSSGEADCGSGYGVKLGDLKEGIHALIHGSRSDSLFPTHKGPDENIADLKWITPLPSLKTLEQGIKDLL